MNKIKLFIITLLLFCFSSLSVSGGVKYDKTVKDIILQKNNIQDLYTVISCNNNKGGVYYLASFDANVPNDSNTYYYWTSDSLEAIAFPHQVKEFPLNLTFKDLVVLGGDSDTRKKMNRFGFEMYQTKSKLCTPTLISN